MKKYDHKKVERKWQKVWEKLGLYRAEDGSPKPKFYCLVEFPYPSGDGLHVGHVRGYTAMDIISRKKRMDGYNVLYPIGWDAFGLPTENFAIKTGQHPAVVTKENIKIFKKQIQSLGLSFDWEREINTSAPEYYKWTQWTFLKLFEHGLAYKAKMPINWCPKCKIGLANEEVIDGKCERCGAETEKREIEQWLLKITAYADRLIEDLETVDYLEKIKTQQINWIGKSVGVDVQFRIDKFNDIITVFTTRSDTLFGATFMVLSPEHPSVNKIMAKEQATEVIKYQEQARKKSDLERMELQKEKTGVFTGAYAINPTNGEKMQIWIADYVMMSYGTGAIMAVPGHDERDFAFAKKYDLPIRQVVARLFTDSTGSNAVRLDKPTVFRKNAYAYVKHWKEDKYICLDWEKYGWHSGVIGGVERDEDYIIAATREIQEETGYQNVRFVKFLGGEYVNLFYAAHKNENRKALGRGMLFELIDDEWKKPNEEDTKNHKAVWIDGSEMRKFINLKNFVYMLDFLEGKGEKCFTGEGIAVNSDFLNNLTTAEATAQMIEWLEKNNCGKKSVNYHLRDWIFSRQHYWGEPIPMVYCEKCHWVPIPEKELPLRLPMVEKYEPTTTGESPLAAMTDWVKTKCPRCKGEARRETDTMPNWAGSSWYFLRYTDPDNKKALAEQGKLKYWMPVDLYNGGMEHTTLHLLYSRFWNKVLYDIGAVTTSEPYQRRISHGMILAPDGQKMSKSRGNVINPDEIVEEYGADVLRLYEMFMGPYDQAVSWDLNGVRGMRRFVERLVQFEKWAEKDSDDVVSLLHKTIKKITEDIEIRHFNTAISAMMIFMNEIQSVGCTKDAFKKFLTLLCPFAPHLAEELFALIGGENSICLEPWPVYDEKLTRERQIEMVVQVNGKIRSKLLVSPDISEEEVTKLALADQKVQQFLAGAKPKKVIFVKGKLLSIVV